MQTSNVKTTLLKLFSANKWFSKIRAAFPTNVASATSGSETENQSDSFPIWGATKEYKMARIEAEIQRARAEEMAHRLRQRIV